MIMTLIFGILLGGLIASYLIVAFEEITIEKYEERLKKQEGKK